MASLSFAQAAEESNTSSLYGIAFGADAEATVLMLKSKGFVEFTRGPKSIHLKRNDNPKLPNIDLDLDEESKFVVGWELYFEPKDNPDILDSILTSLEELHGECDVESDFDADYIWYFPSDKALYLEIYGEGDFNLDYTNGNYDDDEYDYYYYYFYGG